MTRALEPARLALLESGLWAVDCFQPVAAVLDPESGSVRRLVSWPELPPAPYDLWGDSEPAAIGDGTSLWVQNDGAGRLVRIGLDGVEMSVDTGGMWLSACGPGGAWCVEHSFEEEIVDDSADPRMSAPLEAGRLMRVTPSGEVALVRTPAPVASVVACRYALWVSVQARRPYLDPIGAAAFAVRREYTWLQLPWDAELPSELTFAEHHAPEGPPDDEPRGTSSESLGWYVAPDESDPWGKGHTPVVAAGLSWRVGWPGQDDGEWLPATDDGEYHVVVFRSGKDDPHEPWAPDDPVLPRTDNADWRMEARAVIGTADDQNGRIVHRFDLGQGMVSSIEALPAGIALTVRRPSTPERASIVDVLIVDGASGAARTLHAGGTLDISAHCWPLASEPIGSVAIAEQWCQDLLRTEASWDGQGGPNELEPGMTNLRAHVSGNWPEAAILIEFDFAPYPGLRLRRRVPLYDELGRAFDLDLVDVHLHEDLATYQLPSLLDARDGVLEI